jgi:hypothetical protein
LVAAAKDRLPKTKGQKLGQSITSRTWQVPAAKANYWQPRKLPYHKYFSFFCSHPVEQYTNPLTLCTMQLSYTSCTPIPWPGVQGNSHTDVGGRSWGGKRSSCAAFSKVWSTEPCWSTL